MSKSKILFVFVMLVAVLGLSFSSVSPAFAEKPAPVKPIPGLGKLTDEQLRTIWLKKRAWYDSQSKVIVDAYKTADAFQSLIDVEAKKGRDITALDAALTQFYGAITAAEAARVETNNIFTHNAGFNGFFVVLDRNLAGQSIIDAHNSLKSVHIGLVVATMDFKHAYSAWRSRYIRR